MKIVRVERNDTLATIILPIPIQRTPLWQKNDRNVMPVLSDGAGILRVRLRDADLRAGSELFLAFRNDVVLQASVDVVEILAASEAVS